MDTEWKAESNTKSNTKSNANSNAKSNSKSNVQTSIDSNTQVCVWSHCGSDDLGDLATLHEKVAMGPLYSGPLQSIP